MFHDALVPFAERQKIIMATFGEMARIFIPFLLVWILYTYFIYKKAKDCGTSFMNFNNMIFVGYVGLSIGMVMTGVLMLMRL